MAWLDDLLLGTFRKIFSSGTEQNARGGVNFSTGFAVADNPGEDRLDITVTGVPVIADAAAATVHGTTSSIGASAKYARMDHAHYHGAQTNPAHHAVATTSLNGFMSAADKTIVDEVDLNGLAMVDGEFVNPLVLVAAKRYVIEAEDLEADGALAIALAGSGHAANAVAEIIIPSSVACTGLRLAGDLNVADWAPFDPDTDYVGRILCLTTSPLRCESSGTNLGLRDSTIPTLTSVTVFGTDADQLVLVFSEPCYILDIAGLTFGGPGEYTEVTVDSILEGNGTTTIIVELSRELDPDDDATIEFVIAEDSIQDLNGNLLAEVEGEAVVFEEFAYVMPGEIFLYNGATTTYSGSDVNAVANGTEGGSNWGSLAPSGSKPQKCTSAGKDGWEFATGRYLTVDAAAQVDLDEGSLLLVMETASASGSYETPASFGKHGALTTQEISIFGKGSTDEFLFRRVEAGTGDASSNDLDTGKHAWLAVWSAGSCEVFRDGVSVATSGTTADAVDVRRFTLGVLNNLSTFPSQGSLKIYEARASTTKLSGTQIDNTFAYTLAEHGV